MIEPAPMYKLLRPYLMRMLMQRTGTGSSVSIRELAEAVGVPHGTIGNLLTGGQQAVHAYTAHAIARSIGVDTLILFAPVGRSVTVTDEQQPPLGADERQPSPEAVAA